MRETGAGRPPAFPFECLGVFQSIIVIREPAGTIVTVPILKLSRLAIAGLFDGDLVALQRLFPSAGGRSWDAHHAAMMIIAAASARGVIDPARYGLVPIYRRPRRGGAPRVMLLPRSRPTKPATPQGDEG